MKDLGTQTLCDMWRAYERGDLDRQKFWELMRDHHLRLRAYPPLLAKGEVETIQIGATGLIAQLESGLKFFWNPENLREPVSEAVNHGAYERFAGRVIDRCARRASLAIDAGANIGWYSVKMATAMAGGRVIAYEPVGDTAAMLKENIALNRLSDRITVISRGLAARPGRSEIFLPRDTGHVGASLRELHPGEMSCKLTVRLTTLDESLPANTTAPLDLLKCDVEGAELMVLKGGAAVIARDRPVIFLELLRKWSAAFGYHPNEVIAWTEALGYDCWAVGEEQLRYCKTIADDTVETNFLFVQPERDAALIEGLT